MSLVRRTRNPRWWSDSQYSGHARGIVKPAVTNEMREGKTAAACPYNNLQKPGSSGGAEIHLDPALLEELTGQALTKQIGQFSGFKRRTSRMEAFDEDSCLLRPVSRPSGRCVTEGSYTCRGQCAKRYIGLENSYMKLSPLHASGASAMAKRTGNIDNTWIIGRAVVSQKGRNNDFFNTPRHVIVRHHQSTLATGSRAKAKLGKVPLDRRVHDEEEDLKVLRQIREVICHRDMIGVYLDDVSGEPFVVPRRSSRSREVSPASEKNSSSPARQTGINQNEDALELTDLSNEKMEAGSKDWHCNSTDSSNNRQLINLENSSSQDQFERANKTNHVFSGVDNGYVETNTKGNDQSQISVLNDAEASVDKPSIDNVESQDEKTSPNKGSIFKDFNSSHAKPLAIDNSSSPTGSCKSRHRGAFVIDQIKHTQRRLASIRPRSAIACEDQQSGPMEHSQSTRWSLLDMHLTKSCSGQSIQRERHAHKRKHRKWARPSSRNTDRLSRRRHSVVKVQSKVQQHKPKELLSWGDGNHKNSNAVIISDDHDISHKPDQTDQYQEDERCEPEMDRGARILSWLASLEPPDNHEQPLVEPQLEPNVIIQKVLQKQPHVPPLAQTCVKPKKLLQTPTQVLPQKQFPEQQLGQLHVQANVEFQRKLRLQTRLLTNRSILSNGTGLGPKVIWRNIKWQ